MYNGTERRHLDSGRRSSDRDFCGEHHIIQDDKKEHRALVCSKIDNLKKDYLRDVDDVREDLENLERTVQKKADSDMLNAKANVTDLKGVIKFMSVMITICCLVIAGQAIWLKSDISGIAASMQRVHMRITETVDARIVNDLEQAKKLSAIENDISKINWRLDHLEIPDKK